MCVWSKKLRMSENTSILPGYTDSNMSNTRVRAGIKVHQPSVLPIHDGGGDGPRPPSQSHTSRAIKARKAAQMEYKAQLDLQIAQQKLLKEREKTSNNGEIKIATAQNESQTSASPALPSWMSSSRNQADFSGSHQSSNSAKVLPQTQSSPGITFSPFPVLPSENSTVSTFSDPPAESLSHAQVFGRANLSYMEELLEKSTPPAHSQFPKMEASTSDDPHLEQQESSKPIPNQDLELIIPPPPQFSSTPMPIPKNASNAYSGSEHQYQPYSSPKSDIVQTNSPSQGEILSFDSPTASRVSPESSVYGYPQSPQPGTSPCGSVFGDSHHSFNESFGSPSRINFRPHVSQTADQRPDEELLRNHYKAELEIQIQERKRQEEERKRQERLEEERLQEKIKKDQERMRREYEEEQLRLKKKEEEKRQRQEEILKREEAVRKKAEEARLKAIQERRERNSVSINHNPAPEPILYKPPPPSPPIVALLNKSKDEDVILHKEVSPLEETTEEASALRNSPGQDRAEHHRPNSAGVGDAIRFLAHVRELLDIERTEAQKRLQTQLTELNL